MKYNTESKIEKKIIELSGFKPKYSPTEKIVTVILENFQMLGKFTALRFIEWIQINPDGVVSLPTGKTPEYFIKWFNYYISNWTNDNIQKELESYDIDPKIVPDLKNLHFVQIDEFFPINPKHHNSFNYYINKYYIDGFGFDKKRAMLINTTNLNLPEGYTIFNVFPENAVDLTLRIRHPKTKLEELQKQMIIKVDRFCMDYEDKIRKLGGIGFFLGGIGPDGHIGFNISGSDFFSTTRLIPINYETAAAAASDLGGMEISRNRLVITIGLSTIIYRDDVTAIIIAAGDAKSNIVQKSIESEPTIVYPATVLQKRANTRFYITDGASKNLLERNYVKLTKKKSLTDFDIRKNIIDYVINSSNPIEDMNDNDFSKDRFNYIIQQKTGKTFIELKNDMLKFMESNIQNGLMKIKNKTILHTSPHHDDEILSYMPYIIHLIREPSNIHYLSYMTGGFTSVTNSYVVHLLEKLINFINTIPLIKLFNIGYFNKENIANKNDDIYHFLNGVASNSEETKQDAVSRRMIRILISLFNIDKIEQIIKKIEALLEYFENQYPGQKDIEDVQNLKSKIREWEAECVWGYFGFETSNVFHAQLGFYTGDVFTKKPGMESDIVPVLNLLRKTNPDVITVALDPEGSGPNSHYKVLQAVTEALKIYEKESGNKNIEIWGYRNVWYRFHPAEVNTFIPSSLNSLTVLNNIFYNCFGSQKNASFPSYEYDGPFSKLAQKIMVEQYRDIKSCLGEEFFFKSDHPKLRATHAFIYLKKMDLNEFIRHSLELKKIMEFEESDKEL